MIQFPKDFVWGSSTSAYQIEGAHNEGGKGPSIWDAFCQIPGRVAKGQNGNVSIDHYHRFRDDVKLMKDQGLRAYRFSIAWSRILPQGKGRVNEEGIQFYNDLIDALLEQGIEPWPTLYHWDLPLPLQLEEDGWLNPKMADYFADYADVCFAHFGDRAKNWISLNEPWVAAMLGYGQGVFAPGRTSTVEPYIAGHHLLRAHGRATAKFRERFGTGDYRICMANNCDWREPLTDSEEDKAAAERAVQFFLGWFADPLYGGDYPEVMRERLGMRLPRFTDEDRELIKGSSDIFGLNHYNTMYASNASKDQVKADVYSNLGIAQDQNVRLTKGEDWKLTTMNWGVVPWGCRKLLEWIDARYGRPAILITENGCSADDAPVDGVVDDQDRIDFYQSYLEECHKAIQKGVKLEGYFAWSFFDNFEWASGYRPRFGLNYVDYETLERIPKASAWWFKQVREQNGF